MTAIRDLLARLWDSRCRMCDARHHDLVDAQRELVTVADEAESWRLRALGAEAELRRLRSERVEQAWRVEQAELVACRWRNAAHHAYTLLGRRP